MFVKHIAHFYSLLRRNRVSFLMNINIIWFVILVYNSVTALVARVARYATSIAKDPMPIGITQNCNDHIFWRGQETHYLGFRWPEVDGKNHRLGGRRKRRWYGGVTCS